MSRVQKSSKPKTKKANQKPTEPAAGRSLIRKPESAAVAPSVNAPNAVRIKKWPLYSAESGNLSERRLAEMAAEHRPTEEPSDFNRLARVFGTTNFNFIGSFNQQLIAAGAELNFNGLSFMMAVIEDGKPRDHFEAMLIAQMSQTHILTMTAMGRVATAQNVVQLDAAERMFVKLTRTYTSQMEVLKRYRGGGEQKVTVQHVSVRDGSQAIVGNVTRAAQDPALDTPANSPTALGAPGVAKSICDMTDREIADLRRREEADLKQRQEEELRRIEEEDGRYTDLPDAP
jgi:hypothetical protein